MRFNNIGEVISSLRKQMAITQEELGKRVGLSRVIIAKIENSQRAISLEEAVNISKVFSIDVDTLYEYIEEAKDEEKEESFVMAFRAKGMEGKDLLEVKRIELLMDALRTQKEIYRGE
ncbi:MAG: helix-turn-helix domain-containing protein [Anaeromicrobium sp.]|jgi:transcriptional regulator with XRE-family HTH domain|uniref:helix-turn-helix domain-containing protein n=1 Tax=Anaeromicrobium sp. TaxID=1929132 RepID=UPI0025EB8805|nr:helix-turn-helix transcriptional regulator [Anaeromicrobium sp.]MCT4592947.1 helix-turn-helix domain-containing protein [Anaeromicrobium sp.]